MKMIGNMKKMFFPTNYQDSLLRKMNNLKQGDMSVKECAKEFYRLHIRYGHVDDEVEKVVRYLNDLRTSIQ